MTEIAAGPIAPVHTVLRLTLLCIDTNHPATTKPTLEMAHCTSLVVTVIIACTKAQPKGVILRDPPTIPETGVTTKKDIYISRGSPRQRTVEMTVGITGETTPAFTCKTVEHDKPIARISARELKRRMCWSVVMKGSMRILRFKRWSTPTTTWMPRLPYCTRINVINNQFYVQVFWNWSSYHWFCCIFSLQLV